MKQILSHLFLTPRTQKTLCALVGAALLLPLPTSSLAQSALPGWKITMLTPPDGDFPGEGIFLDTDHEETGDTWAASGSTGGATGDAILLLTTAAAALQPSSSYSHARADASSIAYASLSWGSESTPTGFAIAHMEAEVGSTAAVSQSASANASAFIKYRDFNSGPGISSSVPVSSDYFSALSYIYYQYIPYSHWENGMDVDDGYDLHRKMEIVSDTGFVIDQNDVYLSQADAGRVYSSLDITATTDAYWAHHAGAVNGYPVYGTDANCGNRTRVEVSGTGGAAAAGSGTASIVTLL